MERMSYRTDRFKWNDFILFPVLITFLIVFIGQFAGSILVDSVMPLFRNETNSDFCLFLQTIFHLLVSGY